jgi:predicted XRE-type DNA-binding protein
MMEYRESQKQRIVKMNDVVKGSSNVFEDLGFEEEEATNLKIRADLMLDLRKFIELQKWTQAEAAMFFGETQPRISNLINGDIERFGIDKLVQMLSQAGMDIQVLVTPIK